MHICITYYWLSLRVYEFTSHSHADTRSETCMVAGIRHAHIDRQFDNKYSYTYIDR